MGVHRFTDLRAWQACHAYKNAVYRLCATGPLSQDWDRRSQLEESVKGPPGYVAPRWWNLKTICRPKLSATPGALASDG